MKHTVTIPTRKLTMPDQLIREFTDHTTGEIVREYFRRDDDSDKKKKPRDKNFVRARPQALKAFLELNLPSAATRVLLWLATDCSWENYCEVDRAELMARLHLSRKTVWLALATLEKHDLIIFNDQRSKCWIEPTLCWKGYTEKLSAACALYQQRLKERSAGVVHHISPPSAADVALLSTAEQ